MKCIYCSKCKHQDSFKKVEHVIPQSFGRFENNVVLRGKVCDECNQSLGDELELNLARDTAEGLLRFEYGIKKPSEYKGVGQRSRIKEIRLSSGPLKGAFVMPEGSDDHFKIVPLDQIGLMRKDTREFDYYKYDDFPTSLDCSQYILNEPNSVKVLSDNLKRGRELLKSIGIDIPQFNPINLSDNPLGYIDTKIEIVVDTTIKRALCKIAFNYLAYWNETRLLLSREFDPVRNYIRYGEEPGQPTLLFVNESILADEPIEGYRRLGHIITLDYNRDRTAIISRVSLFNYNTYVVILANDFHNRRLVLNQGHFFNIQNGQASELTAIPI